MSSRTAQASHNAAKPLFSIAPSALVVTVFAALLLGLLIRTTVGAGNALWLDETWTGAIAMQGSLREVLYQAHADANAPLYYVGMHAWASLFGVSNASLRLPSLLVSVATPLLCLLPVSSISPKVRLIWSALLALWLPALFYAREARCYSLLLCLGVVGTIALIRLLEKPTLSRTASWAAIGAATCLTHYHAVFLVGCQGIAYVALHRRRALATWPAALLFAPVFGWIAYHLPRIAAFAGPDIAWYGPFSLDHLATLVAFLFGTTLNLAFLALLGAVAAPFPSGRAAAGTENGTRYPWIAAVSAIAGLALVVGVAVLRPTFTFRYAIPFGPGILMGIALLAARVQQRWPIVPIALVLLSGITAVKSSLGSGHNDYNFEVASEWLMASGVRNLVFFWDHPANAVEDPKQLDIVGGFFLRRAGIDATVTPIKVRADEDPSTRLLEATAGKPETGLLWIYNTTDGHVAARRRPPRIETAAPNWICRNFGHGSLGIVACHRRT